MHSVDLLIFISNFNKTIYSQFLFFFLLNSFQKYFPILYNKINKDLLVKSLKLIPF